MTTAGEPWLGDVEDVAGKLGVDPKRGLTAAAAKERLAVSMTPLLSPSSDDRARDLSIPICRFRKLTK